MIESRPDVDHQRGIDGCGHEWASLRGPRETVALSKQPQLGFPSPARLHCSVRSLGLLALLFGLVATGALSLAVATDFWIYIEEPIRVPVGNETEISGGGGGGGGGGGQEGHQESLPPSDQSPGGASAAAAAAAVVVPGVMNVRMHSGLWRLCIIHEEAEDGVPPEVCYNIEYFNQEWGRLEGTDTTNSILRAIRKASPVIVGSLMLLLTALAFSIVGNNKGDFKTIVGAIIYIFSALCLALGVIIYISAVNDEVAHRKKTESTSAEFVFSYRYGWAFFFGAATFMCAMVAAVSNISLHLRRLASAVEDPASFVVVPGGGGGGGGGQEYRPVQPNRTHEAIAERRSVALAEALAMNNNVTIIL